MSTIRIIGSSAFKVIDSPDTWVVTHHDLGGGHRETCVSRKRLLVEVGPIEYPPHYVPAPIPEPTASEIEGKRLANLKRSARRAKTRARRLCKVQALDTLLTLTYKRLESDLEACKRAFNLFVKRMRRAIGEWRSVVSNVGPSRMWHSTFQYVAAFEKQKRGAWHVHIATRALPAVLQRSGVKVKSWNVIRALWRAATGDDGNIDVSSRSRHSRRSPARLASYLSKYMLKDWEQMESGERRMLASQADVPKPSRVELVADSMAILIDLAYAFGADGDVQVVTSWLSEDRDIFFLSSEPMP